MLPAAERRQHRPGVLLIGRFAENLAVALGHGIATEDEAPRRSAGRRRPPFDRPAGRPSSAGVSPLQTPHSAVSEGGRTAKRVAGLRQQLAPRGDRLARISFGRRFAMQLVEWVGVWYTGIGLNADPSVLRYSPPPMNPPPLNVLYEDNHLLVVVEAGRAADDGHAGRSADAAYRWPRST